MASALITAYFLALAVLSLLGLHRLRFVHLARRASLRAKAPRGERPAADVLVQLPLYNEALVAERLMRAAARLTWSGGQVTIQVLDDSTDETRGTVARVAAELAARGVDIQVIRRPTRAGYKAGALAFGLAETQAEVVAIFDADFVPPPDFLERTVPALLGEPRVAMVQARWTHLNREASLLTRAQAVFLDGHFAIEHEARQAAGHFFNFNGTAGVWRRAAIEDAGGWGFDTITEDLELSYRAQLAGWRFVYLGDVTAPAELPESWAAFRSQQARWVRGSVETARKHLGRVWAADLPLEHRLDATIHLTANFAYLLMAVLAVLLPAAVVVRSELGWSVPGGQVLLSVLDYSMLSAGTLATVAFYAAGLARTEGRVSSRRARDLAFALCLGAGMSLSNAAAVLKGLALRGSVFVRTPKRGDAPSPVALAAYRVRSPLLMPLLELTFAAYFLGAIYYTLVWSLFAALPFLLLYFVGFVAVGGGELVDLVQRASHRPSAFLRSGNGPRGKSVTDASNT